MYWVLADVPSALTLSSIYLVALCKAHDVKKFCYTQALEPLLSDLKIFEDEGLFVPCLGKIIKGNGRNHAHPLGGSCPPQY